VTRVSEFREGHKVIIKKGGVSFFNADGKLKKEKELLKENYISKSKNGKAIGVWEALEIDKYKGVTKSKFTFINDEGNVVWAKEDIGQCLVSDDGETAVELQSVLGDRSISFYNSQGLIKRVYPLGDKRFGDGYGVFSGDGNYYAIVTSWPSVLVVYDNLGNELWRNEIIENRAYDINISNRGNYIIVLTTSIEEKKGYVYCFGKDGNLMWKNEGLGGRNVCVFSPDEKYFLLTSQGKKELNLFVAKTGKVVWKQSYEDKEIKKGLEKYIKLSSAAISPDGKFVVLSKKLAPNIGKGIIDHSGKPRYVYLFDKEGNIVWKEIFHSDPRVSISPDGSKIYVTTEEGIYIYTNRFVE